MRIPCLRRLKIPESGLHRLCARRTALKKEAIELILESGGRPVLAHPCKIKADADKLIRELADYGLWGLEVFYPTSTEGQKRGFLSLCAQLGLHATCGSDYHGKNRENPIGGPYEKNQALECAWREFFER